MAHILLIVGGGIAAYKACELVRLIRRGGGSVRCVLTDGGGHFVTPMTLAAISEDQVYTTLWDLKDEAEMGHIQLSREADLLVVAPATADLLARMAAGLADDLATTVLLAFYPTPRAVPPERLRQTDLKTLPAATGRWVEALGGTSLMPGHVRVARGGRVEDLPGYDEGAWWVQDISASLPARLLGTGEGRTALDLCAAPGGKAMQLAAAGTGAGRPDPTIPANERRASSANSSDTAASAP